MARQELENLRPVIRLALWSPATLFLLYIVGVVTAAVLAAIGAEGAAQLLRSVYGHFCHQLPERSLTCGDETLILCARCTGFYGALAAVSIVVLLKSIPRSLDWRATVILCLPMLADALLDLSAMIGAANLVRTATGFLGGTALTLYFYPKLLAAARDQLDPRAATA